MTEIVRAASVLSIIVSIFLILFIYKTNKSQKLLITSEDIPESINKRDDLVFYTKVPKCGSTTIVAILKYLSKRNGFNFQHNWRKSLDVYTGHVKVCLF